MSSQVVDDFENSFQSCLASVTNQNTNHVHDAEEIKTSVDQTIQRFLDSAKSMECFFLQKRLYLASNNPEQLIQEDITDLRHEIQRKDLVIKRLQGKIEEWKGILHDQMPPGPPGGPQMMMAPGVPGHPPPHPSVHPGHPGHPEMSGMRGPHPGMGMRGPFPPGSVQMRPMMTRGPVPPGPDVHMMQQQPPQPHPPQASHMSQQTQQSPLAFLERTTSNIGMPQDPWRS